MRFPLSRRTRKRAYPEANKKMAIRKAIPTYAYTETANCPVEERVSFGMDV